MKNLQFFARGSVTESLDPRPALEVYRINPFAHTCGRVCTHRCETACSVGHRGEPIAIRWLKRYAMDIARTLARMQKQRLGKVVVTLTAL